MSDSSSFQLYLYGPGKGPIDSTFEDAQHRLEQLPHLHFEPDGSFAWAVQPGSQEVFGMIYDSASKIQYCELRGTCGLHAWQQLCFAITGRNSVELEILQIPDGHLHDLQTFEQLHWPPRKNQ